jgi:hypothetical protein
VRTRLFQWVVCLALLGAVGPTRAAAGVRRQVCFASASPEARSSTDEAWRLRPIKKRVGRAVTPTMDRIDNIWFVVSQIIIPLLVIIFSVIYVRRYRAKHAIATADPAISNEAEAKAERQPGPGADHDGERGT